MTLADTGAGLGLYVDRPVPSRESGFYNEAFPLELIAPTDCRIYYTTDGSVPCPGAENTSAYEAPITITGKNLKGTVPKATIIRAVYVTPDNVTSSIATATYFVGTGMVWHYSVPVISLVTDESNLYDSETGIFANYNNRGRDWERPVHFEYFNRSGKLSVSIDCGARVHGGASRSAPAKSLRLYARKEYDSQKRFQYDFFAEGSIAATDVYGDTITSFKRLLLRNAGNESGAWERIYFRDALSSYLGKNAGLSVQACTPCVAFLNGKYYGIMNLRERLDQNYIEDHFDLDSKQIAILEFAYDEDGNQIVMADAETEDLQTIAKSIYQEFYDFATTADLSIPRNYERVCEMVDINDLIEYYCLQLYISNQDWPGNNTKMWVYIGEEEERFGSDGRLRFLLYDTEFSYGLYGNKASYDNFQLLFNTTSVEWPNAKGSTALFRSLIRSGQFVDSFLTRMCDHLNTDYHKEAMLAQINQMKQDYQTIVLEDKRAGNSYNEYKSNIKHVEDFVRLRGDSMMKFLKVHFGLSDAYSLHLFCPEEMGSLEVNGNTFDSSSPQYDSFEKCVILPYYPDCTITLKPSAKPGYRFEGLRVNGTVQSLNPDGTYTFQNNDKLALLVVEALFEEDKKQESDKTQTPADADSSDIPADTKRPGDTTGNSLGVFLMVLIGSGLLLAGLVVFSRIHPRKKRR